MITEKTTNELLEEIGKLTEELRQVKNENKILKKENKILEKSLIGLVTSNLKASIRVKGEDKNGND